VFTCRLLRELLLSLLSRHQQHLVVDMDKTVFIDAAGLGVLVWGMASAGQRAGDTRPSWPAIPHPPGVRFRRVFDIAGLTGEVFAVHDSTEQAIDAVRAKS
jgi:hypothetical protein